MSRSSDEKGADKATAIRRSQARERGNLQGEIARAQAEIVRLNDQRAPIAAEVRKVEAEVGPIKYIAKLIYDDNPDANILEKAVTWVIMIIVAVFDPLALVLILAGQQSIRWAQGEDQADPEQSVESWFERAKKRARFWDRQQTPNENTIDESQYYVSTLEDVEPVFDRETDIPDYEYDDGPLTDEQVKQIRETVKDELPTGKIIAKELLFPDTDVIIANDEYIEVNGKRIHHKAFDPRSENSAHALERHVENFQPNLSDLGLVADNVPNSAVGEMRGFGTSFPATADKGDMFLRVDQLPSVLYKFNGNRWIEVDKALSDQHAYDEAYIDHLIEKISTGEYDPELLSNAERNSIEQRLNNKQS
jgi:hypothetical protein